MVADFMVNVRKVNVLGCSIFENMFKQVWNMLFNLCKFQRMDVVSDSYITNSIKYSERQKRKTVNRIMFHNLQTTSIILNQMDNFWARDRNKQNLQ